MIEFGHLPGRVDQHVAHDVGEDRRRRLRLADDDARLVNDPVALQHRDREVRDIDLDPPLAHVARLPAPHFHVGEDRRPLARDGADGERRAGGGRMNAGADGPLRSPWSPSA